MFSNTQEKDKHKVFISFHNKNEARKIDFENWFGEHFISKSVENGDIDPDNEDEYIKKLIQEDYISDSSVLIALYGANTHKRKHVDWEISAALSAKVGGHSGLVVLLLPDFPVSAFNELNQYDASRLYPYLHPRTADHIESGYTDVYFWPGMYPHLQEVQVPYLLQKAFDRRISHKHLIDNSRPQYKDNR